MSSSPKTKSWPLTSSRLKRPSSSAAYGGRLERKRIHTEVSTRTIIRSRDRLPRPAHVAGESRERVAQIHEAPEAAGTRRVERAPQDQDEPCRYPSLHRRLTWRCATADRRYGGSSSYIQLCHICMAVVTAQRITRAQRPAPTQRTPQFRLIHIATTGWRPLCQARGNSATAIASMKT